MSLKKLFISLLFTCIFIAPAFSAQQNIKLMNCQWTEELKDVKGVSLGINNYEKQFLVDSKNRLLYNRELEQIVTRVFDEKNIVFQIRTRAYDANIVKNYTIDRETGKVTVKSEQEFINADDRAKYGKQNSDGAGTCTFMNETQKF